MDRQEESRLLMAALVREERRALSRLIDLFGPGVRAYATQALSNRADAEEVAQEVFLRVWSKASFYDPAKGSVSTWIWRIAVNLCRDRNRRTGMRQFLGLEAAPEAQDESPDAQKRMIDREDLRVASQALSALPDRQRQALLLRVCAEQTTAEIAQTLGSSPGAIEQLLVRARTTLRAQLAQMEGEDHEHQR